MTVHIAKKNELRKKEGAGFFGKSPERAYEDDKAAYFANMRGFVANFFGCEECR